MPGEIEVRGKNLLLASVTALSALDDEMNLPQC